MRYVLILLLLLSPCLSLNAFQPPIITTPAGVRIKQSASRILFQEPMPQDRQDAFIAAQSKRKIIESDSNSDSFHDDQYLFDYLYEQLPEEDAQELINILSRPLAINVRNETYFEDLFWISNDGHDLRGLAADSLALINSQSAYAALKDDREFFVRLINYLTERYPRANKLRVIIPFGALPASTQFVTPLFSGYYFANKWCKELELLQKWLDTAQAPSVNDPFYQNAIVFLINALPHNHQLLTQSDSCLQPLLFKVAGNHADLPILKALIHKGIEVNKVNAIGQTPLFNAVIRDNLDVVKLLREAGADVNKRSIYQETPLDLANMSASCHKDEIVSLLKQFGAKIGSDLQIEVNDED